MFKLIGGDGKQYGPVGTEEVRRWISEGRLNAQNLAQREGEGAWKTLAEFPEFRDLLMGQRMAQAPPGVAVSAEIWMGEILARPAQVHIGQCFSRSWALLSANAGLLFGSVSIVWAVSTVSRGVPIISFLLSIIYFVFHGVFYGGLYLIFLKRIR